MSPNTSGGEPRNSGGGRVRTVRIGLGALGVAAIAYALAGAAGDPDIVPRRHAGFLLTVLVLHDAWTSPDGRTWRPAPGLRPVAGDTVLGLAGTGSGFVAVGEHTGSQPGPVVWTAAAVGLLTTRVLRRRG